jgi:hypothetical protein
VEVRLVDQSVLMLAARINTAKQAHLDLVAAMRQALPPGSPAADVPA